MQSKLRRYRTPEHRESRALRKEIDGVMQYVGDLQQIWDVALEEAAGGYQIEAAPAEIEIEGLEGLETTAQRTAGAQDISTPGMRRLPWMRSRCGHGDRGGR